MSSTVERPLKQGSIISYADVEAMVLHDYGTSVDVLCEGVKQTWRWHLDGESCKLVSVPAGQLVYRDFNAYVADFPAGERTRGWVTRNGGNLLIAKLVDPPHMGSPHGGLDGNYMWVVVSEMPDGSVRVAAHDCDDGLMVRDYPANQSAEAARLLEDMAKLAPFSMWDAVETFGFRWE